MSVAPARAMGTSPESAASARWLMVLAVGAMALACTGSTGGLVAAAPGPAECPAVDTTAGVRIASVFIDGRQVASGRRARLDAPFPETYSLEGDDPAELKALPVERIDLIQFLRGEDAERAYRLCPGGVAFLITTRASRLGW